MDFWSEDEAPRKRVQYRGGKYEVQAERLPTKWWWPFSTWETVGVYDSREDAEEVAYDYAY